MNKHQLSILAVVLGLIAVLVSHNFLEREPILVDQHLYLGQSKQQFEGKLTTLGYKVSAPSAEVEVDETLYKLPGDDVWTDPLLRVSFTENGKVKTLNGRARDLTYKNHRLVSGQTSLPEIKEVLGKPTWEKHVGNGTTGLCYNQLELYLTVSQEKLTGFSLGEVPKEPKYGG